MARADRRCCPKKRQPRGSVVTISSAGRHDDASRGGDLTTTTPEGPRKRPTQGEANSAETRRTSWFGVVGTLEQTRQDGRCECA